MDQVALAPGTTTGRNARPGPRLFVRRRRASNGVPSVPSARSAQGIRMRRRRDLPTVTRLLRRAFFEGQFPGVRPSDPRAWLEGDDVLAAWVAHEQGEIVAHVAITRVGLDARSARRWQEVTGHRTSELAAVSQLFVRPRFRGQGIGASLVDVACAAIRARGMVPVYEVTTTSSLAPSYSRDHGWRLRSSERVPGTRQGVWIHRFEAGWTHHD